MVYATNLYVLIIDKSSCYDFKRYFRMRLNPSDPDIETIYGRIKNKKLDLQPNFQRGEVWGTAKKQRLIDSIIRGWHIPPIHVIEIPGAEIREVLDGQQRLVSIRDFVENKFAINGNQEPRSNDILELDGLYWSELPVRIRNKFNEFTIRILTVSDFLPGEPGELFHRLNQPTNLTSAEQRNAFFGEARQQVKDITEYMLDKGFNRELIGFSNSRMAYDDVIAKFLLTIENGTLNKKITANTITAKYRDPEGFSSENISITINVLNIVYDMFHYSDCKYKFNKAHFHSWMLFVYRVVKKSDHKYDIVRFLTFFEDMKNGNNRLILPNGFTSKGVSQLFDIYQDRSTSRVSDVSSVILRDIVLNSVYSIYLFITGDLFTSHTNKFYINCFEIINYLISTATITEDKLQEFYRDLNKELTL